MIPLIALMGDFISTIVGIYIKFWLGTLGSS